MWLTLLISVTFLQEAHLQWYRSIYQVAQQDHELSGFNSLVQLSRLAKQYLGYNELTVFVPDNEAFRKFRGELTNDMALYHMTFEMKSLQTLNTSTNSVTPALKEFPPIWITRTQGDIYVNNAKLIKRQSNYLSRIRNEDFGKQQILHTIDEVLNPMIISPKSPPNAYDFLSSSFKWNLPGTVSVSKFLIKIQESKLQQNFKENTGHTFFIPIDSGIDSRSFRLLDSHVIRGHVIPFYVLFTRPTQQNFAYETLANDFFMFTVVSFVDVNGTTFVKARSSGHGSKPEEFLSEILVPNIPVKNGVVHLISKPLMSTLNSSLGLFPYLPVIKKISTDPELEVFYEMGERTEFNKKFNAQGVQFTYFVPRDTAWNQVGKNGLVTTEQEVDILGRHLIVSQSPYFIEQLESLTKANNNSYVELTSEGGPLKIMVLRINDAYYVKWYDKYIKVLRPNYECTDGVVHVLAGPMIDFQRQPLNESTDYKNYWETFNRVFKQKFKKISF